ncbi:hypothetical protein HK405_014903 [Cladochytrium tenue]|nr:hypothetical protein HK405_014903 [Cladochytrium tenue]
MLDSPPADENRTGTCSEIVLEGEIYSADNETSKEDILRSRWCDSETVPGLNYEGYGSFDAFHVLVGRHTGSRPALHSSAHPAPLTVPYVGGGGGHGSFGLVGSVSEEVRGLWDGWLATDAEAVDPEVISEAWRCAAGGGKRAHNGLAKSLDVALAVGGSTPLQRLAVQLEAALEAIDSGLEAGQDNLLHCEYGGDPLEETGDEKEEEEEDEDEEVDEDESGDEEEGTCGVSDGDESASES